MRGNVNVVNVSTDVLIIGGGAAAGMAALEALKYGLKVTLADKGRFGRSGSAPTSGGALAPFLPPELGGSPNDSEEQYLKDLCEGSWYVNNQETGELEAEEGSAVLSDLRNMGVPYPRDREGRFLPNVHTMGMPATRGIAPEAGAGAILMEVIRKEALSRRLDLIEKIMVTTLVVRDGEIMGALGWDVDREVLYVFEAPSVILACGSATGLYRYRSANFPTTGDGYALGYRVGLELMNMEFVEFTLIPTPRGIAVSAGGTKPVTSVGGIWRNNIGEPIMEQYAPMRKEFAGRSIMVQANYLERIAGRGPITIDLTHVSEDKTRWMLEIHYKYALTDKLRALGVDYHREPIEWAPGVHTFLGGIGIASNGGTDVSGLFAAGETGGHGGLNGADRASLALLSCGVIGKRAGRSAARWALGRKKHAQRKISSPAIQNEIARNENKTGVAPGEVRKQLIRTAWERLNVVRDEKGLGQALSTFTEIQGTKFAVRDHQAFISAKETQNLALVGEMVCRSALARRESRGQHLRSDFPHTDNNDWLKWIAVKGEDGAMKVHLKDIPFDQYRFQPTKGRFMHPAFDAFIRKASTNP